MIDRIRELPTLPQVTLELMTLAFSDEPDIQAVAAVIEKDPTLTAKLLKTVNSTAFGLLAKVTTVQQAVSILGLEALRATIITIALGDYFVKGGFGKSLDVRAFCAHSLAVAVIMREAAESLRIPEKDLLYLLGLLHDLDKLVLDFLSEDGYAPVLERAHDGTPLNEAERDVLGVEGKQVWMEAARIWEFPPRVTALYEGTVEGSMTLSTRRLIRTASRMADDMGHSFLPAGLAEDGQEDALLTQLPEETVLRIGKAVQDQAEALSSILILPPPNQEEVQLAFLKTTRRLSMVNAELELKIDMLDRLTRASLNVIKSLESDAVTLPVLQGLVSAFQAGEAFLLQDRGERGLAGVLFLPGEDDGKPEVRKVEVSAEKISAAFRKTIDEEAPLRIDRTEADPILRAWFGEGETAWMVPVMVKGRFHSLLGIAAGKEGTQLFQSDDLRDALRILAAELGLAFEVARLHRKVRIEAMTDPLTRIYNRGTILNVLKAEFARFRRSEVPLSLALFDMDRFKSLNDTLGHLRGDEFLIAASCALKESVRETDYVGRYGGDEFVALFPGIPVDKAYVVVERVRARLEEVCASFSAPDRGVNLSVSVGLADAQPEMSRSNDLLLFADNALYEAKEGGRNRCVVATRS